MITPSRVTITHMRIWKDKKSKWHRLRGPAIEWDNGTKWWHTHGLCRHSEYGDQARKEEHPKGEMPPI